MLTVGEIFSSNYLEPFFNGKQILFIQVIELKPALNNVLTIVIVYIRYLSMLITSTQSRLISFIESSSRYSKVTNK